MLVNIIHTVKALFHYEAIFMKRNVFEKFLSRQFPDNIFPQNKICMGIIAQWNNTLRHDDLRICHLSGVYLRGQLIMASSGQKKIIHGHSKYMKTWDASCTLWKHYSATRPEMAPFMKSNILHGHLYIHSYFEGSDDTLLSLPRRIGPQSIAIQPTGEMSSAGHWHHARGPRHLSGLPHRIHRHHTCMITCMLFK